MALSVTLKSKQVYTDSKNGMTITGTAGNETVSIAAKTNAATISNVANVKLPGKLAEYAIMDDGGNVVVKQGDTIIAAISPADHGTVLAFSDGSKLDLNITQDGATHSFAVVQMIAKTSLTVANNNVTIKGLAGGSETVNLDIGLRNVTIDSKVEKVIVNANLGDLSLIGIKAGISLFGVGDVKIADLMLGAGHAEILQFNDATVALNLKKGVGAYNLSSVSLSAGSSFTSTGSGITFTSDSASDHTTVALQSGHNKEHIGSGIGQVGLPGKFSDYKYLHKSGVLYVYDAKGTTIIADIQLQRDSNGTDLAFSNGTHLSATLDNGAIKIGIATVAITKPAIITLPAPGAPPPSGTSNFHYEVAMGNFGQYQSQILADVTAALNNIGAYLDVKGVFNVQINPKTLSAGVIAQASGNMAAAPVSLQSSMHNAGVLTDFQIESLTGTDPNPSGYDAVVDINMANIARLNLDPNSTPSSTQIDLTTALIHEMIHAMGFAGYTGNSTTDKTTFDTYITMQGGKPYFTGPSAVAVYGGPVPLAPAAAGKGSAYFHVDIAGDLMATALGPGQVRAISALDLAFISDLGIPEVALVGTPAHG